MFSITPSARLRPSPFFEATLAEGVTAFTTYNHMLMPTAYGDPAAEYWRLIEGVSQWDVAVERQVQLRGPDAARLAQILAPRDLSRQQAGQGKYVPLCDHRGVLINDPICLSSRTISSGSRSPIPTSGSGLVRSPRSAVCGSRSASRMSRRWRCRDPEPRTWWRPSVASGCAASSISGSARRRSTAFPSSYSDPDGPSKAASRSTCARAARATAYGRSSKKRVDPTASAQGARTGVSASSRD